MALGRAPIVALLLGGPTALAFFSGGYFERPRLWAGVVAWLLVVLTVLVVREPRPRGWPARLALVSLAGLTAWTALSIGWTPVRDVAQGDTQRLLLYVGVLLVGAALLRERSALRAVEPVLAAGVFVVVLEGLSERLLPGLFSLAPSAAASGRLQQPLTYWNAMGLLAAIGTILTVRVAGDATRRIGFRVAAAAATPTLAVGGYATLSRGAFLAAAIGLTILAGLQPTRSQLRALAVLALASAPAVLVGALLDGVRALAGPLATRERQGLVMLGVLVAAGAAAAAVVHRTARWDRAPDDGAWAAGRRVARLALAAVAVATIILFTTIILQRHTEVVNPVAGATNARLASVESNRGDFWRVARNAFAEDPVRGVGSGGFQTEWLRERAIPYAARDAHSLYFETAAELGLVGLLLLGGMLVGVAAAARRAHRRDAGLAAGPIAVVAMWAVHAGLDWDWEMPGVTLLALLAAAALLALADGAPRAPASGPDVEDVDLLRPVEVVS